MSFAVPVDAQLGWATSLARMIAEKGWPIMIPSSSARVPMNTVGAVNQQIQDQIEKNVLYYTRHPGQIGERLRELDREWDVERLLETNAATAALLGTLLAAAIGRRWLILTGIVTGFLLQHAIQGWCPPLPILRRLGFRTPHEIESERYALKAIRGDFKGAAHRQETAETARARKLPPRSANSKLTRR